MNKTALSYWFPKIEAAGIPVPKTRIVKMPREAMESILAGFDGKDAGDPKPFFETLKAAAAEIGFPAFLRTNHTSGKHEWERCCYLKSADDIPRQVFALAEYSEIAGGIMGLPWDTWVVREFLPTLPLGICPRYANMPICREFRYFVEDGHVRCWHPYWPEHALTRGGAILNGGDLYALSHIDVKQEATLISLAEKTGCAVGGAWSIDILETKRGWFVTDMAEANVSWHDWPECPNNFRKA